MKREDFIKIIKLRSFWKIDRRKGNYKLPSGEKLDSYIRQLVESQLSVDGLGIAANGNLYTISGGTWNEEAKYFNDYVLSVPFSENEICSYDDYNRRLSALISEIIG